MFTYGTFITDLISFIAIASAVFFFIVKPVDMIAARRRRGEVEVEEVSDEECRHQELLAALRPTSRSA